MSTVCFAALDSFHAYHASCRISAELLGGAWAVIPAEGPTPAAALHADLLILSSWCPRYEMILTERSGPTVPRWHSTLVRTGLFGETSQLARLVELLEQGVVPAVATDDAAVASVLSRSGVFYLPNVPAYLPAVVQPARLVGVNVSLFGPAHTATNLIVQSAAFALARRRSAIPSFTLHLNGQTLREPACVEWLALAGIAFVDHGWLDRSTYLSLVAAMDVGLCATLSASDGDTAADHVELGVPVVASPAVACLGDYAPRVPPHDVEAVAAALSQCLSERGPIARAQRLSFEDCARVNLGMARRSLDSILARSQDHRRAVPPSRLVRFRELRTERT